MDTGDLIQIRLVFRLECQNKDMRIKQMLLLMPFSVSYNNYSP